MLFKNIEVYTEMVAKRFEWLAQGTNIKIVKEGFFFPKLEVL